MGIVSRLLEWLFPDEEEEYSLTPKGRRVCELINDGWGYTDALAKANREFGDSKVSGGNKKEKWSLTPEQRENHKAIRERFRHEHPGPDELIARGEIDELIPHGEFLKQVSGGNRGK